MITRIGDMNYNSKKKLILSSVHTKAKHFNFQTHIGKKVTIKIKVPITLFTTLTPETLTN